MKRRIRKKLWKIHSTYRIVQVHDNHGWPLLTLDDIVQVFPGQYSAQVIRYPRGYTVTGQARILKAERNRLMRLQAGREIVVMM